jgi:hypothetical protein
MTERDAIGLAALFAYVQGNREAVDLLLEKDGNWNVTGVGNGTLLHRAAWDGDLEVVQRLVRGGADISVRDPQFGASPLAWAGYNSQRTLFEWMCAHLPIDLHDAVAYGLRAHVEARLREESASVHARRTQWEIPDATPLHVAAFRRHQEIARLLLQHGADPNTLAGNGMTALDVADFCGATPIAALLEAHGGTRTREAARRSGHPALQPFERLAKSVLEAYVSGAEAAVARVQAFFSSGVTAQDIRTYVQRRLQKKAGGAGTLPAITMAEARDVVAGARGFGSWADLAQSVLGKGKTWARPLYWIDRASNRLQVARPPTADEWDTIVTVLAEQRIERLDAAGYMTDEVLARIADLEHLTGLQLAQSKRVTDAGLRHLPRFARLQWLNLSGCSFTDEGLEALRSLPSLRTFELHWHRGVSDEGIEHLAACELLERVDVMGSPLGDGLIRALAGRQHLRFLKTGTRTTDSGLALLYELPIFRTWHGGELRYSLMSADAGPNHLVLDGPFTDAGLASLRELEGLFGLSFFWHSRSFSPEGLAVLAALPNLGFLGCEGERCTDRAMRHIAAIPRLRMLQAQGTVASDAGFAALSRSATLEYLWGRECPNLTGRGFEALVAMPALRGLAVSCRRVDDSALSRLPQAPALRELMPMDVSDAGFSHVGRCDRLEGLWCMYCRDTTDAATDHIAGLPALRTYYAGQTQITDRSLEILSDMGSIESLEFWNCAGITNAGASLLARLPRLREVAFDNCRHVSAEAVALFPSTVRVRHTG